MSWREAEASNPAKRKRTSRSSEIKPGPMNLFKPRPTYSFENKVNDGTHRNRTILSCIPCRSRKSKCDRQRPCGPCKDRGKGNQCRGFDEPEATKPKGYTHVQDFSILSDRVNQLELALSRAISRLDDANEYLGVLGSDRTEGDHREVNGTTIEECETRDGLSSTRAQPGLSRGASFMQENTLSWRAEAGPSIRGPILPNPDQYQADYQARPSRQGGTPQTKAPEDWHTEHGVSMRLEDMMFGREGNVPRPPEDTSVMHTSFQAHVQKNLRRLPTLMKPAGHILSHLPSPFLARPAIDSFMNDGEYISRVIHKPSFYARCQNLWSTRPGDTATTDELAFIGLYMGCAVMGLRMMNTRSLHELDLTLDQAIVLAQQWYQVCYAAQEASDWLQRHTVTSCQAIIITSPYLTSVHRGEQAWTSLGSAIRIAQSLGLHRLVPEPSMLTPSEAVLRYGDLWSSRVEREVGRRIWCHLVQMDQVSALERDFAGSIPPWLGTDVIPANTNDSDLAENLPLNHQPVDVYTDMSYSLYSFVKFKQFRELSDQACRHGGRLDYHHVIEAQERLQTADFRPGEMWSRERFIGDLNRARSHRRECIWAELMDSFYVLQMHRPFLPLAYSEPSTYGRSRTECIDQTSKIFDLMHEAIEADDSAMAFSRASNMTFIATMVGFMALCHEGSPAMVDDLCQMVRRGITLLRRVPPTGAIGKAADLVQGMLERERTRRCLYIDHEIERDSFDKTEDAPLRPRSRDNLEAAFEVFSHQPLSLPNYAVPGEEEVDLFALLNEEPQLLDLLYSSLGQPKEM